MRNPLNNPKGRDSKNAPWFPPCFAVLTVFLATALTGHADDAKLADEVRLLREQNALLQQQVQKQGSVLDALTQKVSELETSSAAKENSSGENAAPTQGGFNLGKVNLSAEGGVAFFNTGPDGFAPHSDFRVDDARLFLEAPIWNEVYFFSDIAWPRAKTMA